ncbi:MAG: peptidase S10 [Myxococcales bacterium]|nr:peptidase S10 [Myxococcales bacterium]
MKRCWESQHKITLDGRDLSYRSEAGFVDLFERDKPIAELFYSAYLAEGTDVGTRPVTFVFNGGPGASSSYLHIGALGPRRAVFGDQGEMLPSPVKMTDNTESWLSWSDLIFLDPIGTGWSRALDEEAQKAEGTDGKEQKKKSEDTASLGLLREVAKPAEKEPKEARFWTLKQDLNSLCEAISRLLSRYKRWASPVFLAGESYGGFRVARLVRQLQEDQGIGLNGAILISPAIQFSEFYGTDYNLFRWIDMLPTMAAAAHHHGKVKGKDYTVFLKEAESFAMHEMLQSLALGDALPQKARNSFLRKFCGYTGLSAELVERYNARVPMEVFCKEFLQDQRKVVGLYDASMACYDAFPDRPPMAAPDPSFAGIQRIFNAAIQRHLYEHLGVEMERAYLILNMDTFEYWKNEEQIEMQQGHLNAADHFRYGLFMNDSMRVLVSHGHFDLVTPYFTSDRLVSMMRLPEEIRQRVTLQHFHGGHMFYTWKDSRLAFAKTAKTFYQSALSHL